MWLIVILVAILLAFSLAYLYWIVLLKSHMRHPIRCFLIHEVVPRPSLLSASEIAVSKFLTFVDEVQAEGFTFVSPEHFLSSESSSEILLTFDDGFESFYEHVYPILKAKTIPALVFTVRDYTGKDAAWDYRNSGRKHLSPEQIDEMAASRLVFFGSHSASHPDLTRLSEEKLAQEIKAVNLDLFECFSYPFGKFNPDVIAAVKKAGYYRAFCSLNGDPKLWGGRFAIPRIPLNRFDNRFTLRTKIMNGKLLWLEVVKARIIGMFAPFTHDWKGR
ncbi:MAG: polysaccharide deacetylase family protein [candidate division Zixibacteria bacterium]|nr:polysaccharide deacetylase family protein [candidate division Zixibacteria bacterium]MBU1469716.1 polysaccharide deacetylase family protein [candidate division Zixibacteria bacterium]MBU2624853.1 polysaccharide deacetylase family protein [candidate division Zixibacteria bacterium]